MNAQPVQDARAALSPTAGNAEAAGADFGEVFQEPQRPDGPAPADGAPSTQESPAPPTPAADDLLALFLPAAPVAAPPAPPDTPPAALPARETTLPAEGSAARPDAPDPAPATAEAPLASLPPPTTGTEQPAPPADMRELLSGIPGAEEDPAPWTPRAADAPAAPTKEWAPDPGAAPTGQVERDAPDPLPAAPPPAPAAPNAPADPAAAPRSAPIALHEMARPVLQAIRHAGEAGHAELRFRLDPPALGEIQVQVERTAHGVAVRLVAQSQETLLLLQNQRAPLQDELERQSIRMESFTASLAGDPGGQRPDPRGGGTAHTPTRSGDADARRAASPRRAVPRPLSGRLDARA